jgi:lipopolysaccharide export system protein LptA
LIGITAALGLLPGAGLAQTSGERVTFDPDAETVFDADRVEIVQGEGGGSQLNADGNVLISQPGVILTSDKMIVFQAEGSEELQRLVATGRVRYASVSGDAIAGDAAEYRAFDQTLTVSGNVVLLQDGQVATGSRLIYNVETGEMSLTAEPGSRVKGLLPQRASR